MIRWIDQVILILLLLISVGLIALWFRSQTLGDRYRWVKLIPLPNAALCAEIATLSTGEGGIGYRVDRRTASDSESVARVQRWIDRATRFSPAGYMRIDTPRYPLRGSDETVFSTLGFYYGRESRGAAPLAYETFELTIPLWFPLLVMSAYPLIRFFLGVMRREQAERAILGLCPRCGSNVLKSPDRCPVCGKHEPLCGTGFTSPNPIR